MIHGSPVRVLGLLSAVFYAGCAAKAPTPVSNKTEPPTQKTADLPPAASSAPVPVAEASDAGVPTPPPACIPPEIRAEGRVMAAHIDPNNDLRYCVRKGIGSEAPTRCLVAHFASGKFEAAADVWPTVDLAQGPEAPAPGAHATLAHNAGTLDVCDASGACVVLRIRPPNPGAWDEVFGVLPAVQVPGTSRVLYARVAETWPKNGPSNSEIYVDAVDLKRKAKVGGARAAQNEWSPTLRWLGTKALLGSCTRDNETCRARVIDPNTLAASKLDLEIGPEENGYGGEGSSLLQRTASGSMVLIDRSGSKAIWLSAEGKVTRKVELGPKPADAIGIARAGQRNEHELVVLRTAPNAGSVVLVGIDDGAVTRLDPPACAD